MRRSLILATLSVAFFTFSVFFTSPGHAFAQLAPSLVTLLKAPAFPAPHESVEVSLSDYAVDTVGADIFWYVDGAELPNTRNARSVIVTAGAIGETKTVRADLVRKNAPTLSAATVIRPAVVDLVLEAATYVPDFYRGRALPSDGAPIRAVAVVNDGTDAPESSYTYKWSESGDVLLGGPVKGKNVLDLTMTRYRKETLSVEVINDDGDTIGKRTIPLVSAEPTLIFYEHSPLRGLLERAMSDVNPLIGDEMTVYGEPYFLDARTTRNDGDFTWTIDGTEAPADGAPNALTLSKEGTTGSASIDLRIVTKRAIPQLLRGGFTIFFD
ncbi:MAG TPA: hypothetical protein VFS75_01605 [Candidatus Paceibacterota bacterium]|nr:hypothetical protein [Candidatus Paceibacterota bacterium]